MGLPPSSTIFFPVVGLRGVQAGMFQRLSRFQGFYSVNRGDGRSAHLLERTQQGPTAVCPADITEVPWEQFFCFKCTTDTLLADMSEVQASFLAICFTVALGGNLIRECRSTECRSASPAAISFVVVLFSLCKNFASGATRCLRCRSVDRSTYPHPHGKHPRVLGRRSTNQPPQGVHTRGVELPPPHLPHTIIDAFVWENGRKQTFLWVFAP